MHRLFNILKNRARMILHRVFPTQHALVRRPFHAGAPSHEGHGGSPHPYCGPDVGRFHTNGNEAPPDIEQGIHTIYEPAHEMRKRTTFRHVSETGDFENSTEVWLRDGNRMIVTEADSEAIDASGRLVPVHKLAILCSICGGYDSTGGHCYVCARPLCGTHGLLCTTESNQMVCLCPEHFASMAKRWNTWAANDARMQGGVTCHGPSAHPISGSLSQGASYAKP